MSYSPSMNRRNFIRTAATAVGMTSFSGALAACGSTTSSTNATVTLKYWDSYVTQAGWVDNEIALFQQAHKDIKIKKTTQGAGNYDNLYGLAVRGNNAPDVAMIPGTPNFGQQVGSGWWLPIDKWANAQWRAKFPTNALHEGSNIVKGKLYSAPVTTLTVPFQLYINNSVFRNAGLVDANGKVMLPRTWDDVTHAAEAINKKSNNQVYGLGFGNGSFNLLTWWMFVFVVGAGAPGGPGNYDLRTGKYTFSTNRAYTDWLQLWKEWKTKGYFYPNSVSISDEVARAYFERGKFGMTVGGVWDQSEWKQHGFNDYSLTTLITPNQTPDSYFPTTPGGTFVAISAKTAHQDEAWAWFDWLYSVEAGKRWVQMGEDLSIYPQNNDPKFNTDPRFSQYVATAQYALPGPDTAVRNPDCAFVAPQTVKPDMGDVMTGYYTGQISDLRGALSQLDQRYQKALNDAIKIAQQQGHKVTSDDYVFADWDPTKPYVTKPR